MDQWMTFAQDRWYILAAVIIGLLIVITVVKTVVKWVIILALLAGVVYYGANYTEELKTIGGKMVSAAKDDALQSLSNEAKDAKYQANKDGTFTVTTKTVRIEGKAGASDVAIYFKDQKIGTFKADGVIQTVIEQAKSQAK